MYPVINLHDFSNLQGSTWDPIYIIRHTLKDRGSTKLYMFNWSPSLIHLGMFNLGSYGAIKSFMDLGLSKGVLGNHSPSISSSIHLEDCSLVFSDFGPPTFGRKGSYKITPVVS